MPRIRSAIRGALATVAVAAVLALPLPAAARETVDPASLTPAPRPGREPAVRLGREPGHLLERPPVHGHGRADRDHLRRRASCSSPSQRHTVTQRFYNADLLLTKRMTHEWIDGILYVPATGELVRWTRDRPRDPDPAGARRPEHRDRDQQRGDHPPCTSQTARSITIAGRTIEDFDTGAYVQVGSNAGGVDFCALIA